MKSSMPDFDNILSSYTKENIEKLCEFAKEALNEEEILVVIGSKKVVFENELNQELDFIKYFLVYIIIAFKLLNKGGSLVLRTYDHHLPFTCQLLYLLCKKFEQITIIKPLTSNLHSAERFVVASNFLYEGKALRELVEQLCTLLEFAKNTALEGREILSIMDLGQFQSNLEFKNYVLEENSRIEEWRIQSFKNILELAKSPYKELGGKDEVKDLCLKLWGIPVLRPASEKLKKRQEPMYYEKSDEEQDELLVLSFCTRLGSDKRQDKEEGQCV
eukprot:TRINITY_DN4697_c0_g2_i5.p1 TRINITY_DN4697_c0_g2~~TRINITY_DN4697_c0_g2_i5.p1  ORF type:complete len:274 (+),score=112.12 TRINITY_DN4697_c0_g2_i5:1080-1901(+)